MAKNRGTLNVQSYTPDNVLKIVGCEWYITCGQLVFSLERDEIVAEMRRTRTRFLKVESMGLNIKLIHST